MINAGQALSDVLIRRGRYEEARELLDEMLPLARRVGGGEYLSPSLRSEAELESARGNLAAARKSVEEVIDLAMATQAVMYSFRVLELAARLVPERVQEPLGRARAMVLHPYQEARVKEADGLLAGDRALLAEAAELFLQLEMPYQEARCLLDAGEFARAAEIIKRLGIQNGPLGERLRRGAGEPSSAS